MERTTVSLRAAVAMCAATAVVFLAGVFAAHAWPGRPGVEARSFFTVAGTLAGVPAGGLRSLRFTFHKMGAADCVATADDLRYDAPNFSAQVPYEACGRGFFDGSDVSFDVAVNDAAIVAPDGGFRVNPVPYAQFASVAGAVGTADCPVGYEWDPRAPGFTGDTRLCVRKRADGVVYDEVVRVGTGASAFWIDRYEASVWLSAAAVGESLPLGGSVGSEYHAPPGRDFQINGQWRTPLYALSRGGVTPSAFISWYQADVACRLSGKQLPSGPEWLAAASGTADPAVATDGASGDCRTLGSGRRNTGRGALCVSRWGAQDMIGNLEEFTSEWFAAVAAGVTGTLPHGDLFGNDGTRFVAAGTYPGPAPSGSNAPGVAVRGGATCLSQAEAEAGNTCATRAGIFALRIDYNAAAGANGSIGFRCVIPR